ncbi:hypothetical protein NQ317_018911 [Molorchus minor]|uniref:RZZ complex subunit KNTC1/ROD C-terminal domain-containing protein n=1 Tax=Molorchus minor TaxID=1323400 RepID=A0ABQ9JKV2_9CUCU|nr:hypothetical protein NQ317_018911 [Molorchus minor]
MEDFAIIESGFSNADETINFGTRAIGHDSLYEISTIACFKCSEDNTGVAEVVLNSLVNNGKYTVYFYNSFKERVSIHSKSGSDDIEVNSEEMYDFGYILQQSTFSYPLLFVNGSEAETLFDDVLTMDDNNGNKQIVAVTRKNEQGESFLQLLNSDFSVVFSLKLSHPIHIIQLENASYETLIISKIFNNGVITELRAQCVCETEPELRLARLIKKQRFEEAEKFAKTFNMDPGVISKARAQIYVDKTDITSEDTEILISILETVDDDLFKLQCCSNVECYNSEDARRILTYGSKIMPKGQGSNKENAMLLQSLIVNTLFKFDTYMAVHSSYDSETWCRFVNSDLLEEMKNQLENFRIEEAIIICSRLDPETLERLTEDKIGEIMSILNNLPITIYQPFLPTFIPVAMSRHGSSVLPVFITWLQSKIFQLEKRDNYNFPEYGIKFAEFILKLLKVESDTCLSLQRQCTINMEGLDLLAALMEALKALQKLKTDFKINISLAEYLAGPKNVIRTLLNIVMAPEDYDHFLKEFLYKFMIQNHFEPDEIFLKEIKDLIKYDEAYWVNIVESILKYISSIKIKLEAVKEILENAQVPWCETIKKIGTVALQYSHPLVAGIKDILENEPRLVVLRNPKYKIKEKQITTVSELQYLVKRIVYINEPSMIDDIYQLCKTPRERVEASIILVQHFIRRNNFEEAMKVLDNNTKEDLFQCTKWLCSYAEVSINNTTSLHKLRDNYYNIAGSLFSRLVQCCDSELDAKRYEDDLRTLRGVYNINKHFQRCVTTDHLSSPFQKTKLLNELIDEAVNITEKGTSDITNILGLCDKLATYLSLDKDDILLKYCQKIAKFDVILESAEHLYKSECSPKNLCLAAVLLLRYVGTTYDMTPFSDSFNDSSCDGFLLPSNASDVFQSSEDSNNNFILGIKLAQSIVRKALVTVDADHLPEVIEVMNWVDSCFYLTRYQENPVEAELFKQIYHSEHTVPGVSAFSAVRNMIVTYVDFGQLVHEISTLPALVDTLCREGQQMTAYKLLVTFENALGQIKNLDPAVVKPLNVIISKRCLPQLLHAVVSAKHIDLSLFHNLLLACQKDYFKYVKHYLKLYKRQPRKLRDIALVGIQLLDYHKVIADARDTLVDAVLSCKYWNKLKADISNSIPYDVFFKMTCAPRLKQLIRLNAVDVGMICDYCNDYNLDVQAYYMEYLKSSFVNWKPRYEVKIDIDGKRNLILKKDEHSLHIQCQEIIDVIKDKEAAFALMNKIWDVANFYHYEVFICILKILSNNGRVEATRNSDMPMLIFLKSYRRFSSPSQSEKEQWYTVFPDSQSLDPLSEFRLPFIQMLFTYDIWNIIRPEINLKSYRCWFNAVNILRKNLKKDDICIYAVKDVMVHFKVTSGILGENTGTWVLYPKFEDLFAEVDECLQHISDLERATSVVYHLMYHTPDGADKVNAAQLSFKYAKKYKETHPNSPDVEKAFVKVKNKYYSFSAMHILHIFQLTDNKYIQLVAQPEDLIDALYMDDKILKQADSVDLSCPDINKAVDAIAELFGMQIRQIRYNLLTRWLTISSTDIDFDSTTTVIFPGVAKTSNIGDDNLKRATYLCSSEKSFWQPYVLKVGLNDDNPGDSEHNNFAFKAKALKCFCAISNIETITRLTEGSYKDILNYIDKLSLLSELECLGIALNIETLDQYNKKDLLKRLSQIGKPAAFKVMAIICKTYVIKDLRYWEYIINNTVKLGMAWQVIVDDAFNLPNNLSGETLYEAYVNNFLMIQSCPVLYSLNFEKIIQKCIEAEKFEFAAILLLYLPEKTREIYVKDVLRSRTISLDLDNLSKSGVWGIRKLM